MCGLMTFGRKQWDHLDETMRAVLPDTHRAMKDLIPMVDSDSDAFNQFMVTSPILLLSSETASNRFRQKHFAFNINVSFFWDPLNTFLQARYSICVCQINLSEQIVYKINLASSEQMRWIKNLIIRLEKSN